MVSTSGMVVSLKTESRFPFAGQHGHGSRIIQLEKKIKKVQKASKVETPKVIKETVAEKKAEPMKFTKEKIKENNKKDNYIVFSKAKKTDKLQNTYKETEHSEYSGYAEKENVLSLNLTGEQAKKIQKQSGVLHIEKDIELTACEEEITNRKVLETTYKDNEITWNKEMIKANDADKFTTEKVKVAILDSGIDYGNDVEYVEQINLIPGEEELTPLFTDSSGHGASVAGIIAAQDNDEGITGINPNVEIYSAKILDDNNSAPVSRVVEGIYWAMEKDVNIINLSFSTPQESQILEKAIKDAYNQGILIIAAAGNDENVEYPAAYPEVIAVGSVNSEGIVSENSGKGEELEIVAPGEKVTVTSLLGGTTNTSGTSLAAPHIVGVASLLWEKDLTVSHTFIRDLLNYSANGYGEENAYGNGLVDYDYACSIYEQFKADYSEKKADLKEGAEVEENTSECVVFEDNNAVEGKWAGHGDMAAQYTDVLNFQYGAKAPDTVDWLEGLNANHAWHGGRFCNYVADYVYVVKVAEAVGKLSNNAKLSEIKSTILDVGEVKGMNQEHKDYLYCRSPIYMQGVYKTMQTNLIDMAVEKNFEDRTAKQRKAFIYGMASHIVTDVYAHSTFRFSGISWYHIMHESEGITHPLHADNIECIPRRIKSAKEILNKVVTRFEGNGSKYIFHDFLIDDYLTDKTKRQYYNASVIMFTKTNKNADATYRLYNFKDYMNEAGVSNSSYLDMCQDITTTIVSNYK